MLANVDLFKYDARMTPALWDVTTHFKYDEEWGDPYKMWVRLIYYLDAFRIYIHPNKLIIHCGWELRESGWHPAGAAVDLHCPTIFWKELAYIAMQFPFTGIGLYPYWNNPGVHLDVRPLQMDSRRRVWWRKDTPLDDGTVKKEYFDVNNYQEFREVKRALPIVLS